jgi:hypothetical protein
LCLTSSSDRPLRDRSVFLLVFYVKLPWIICDAARPLVKIFIQLELEGRCRWFFLLNTTREITIASEGVQIYKSSSNTRTFRHFASRIEFLLILHLFHHKFPVALKYIYYWWLIYTQREPDPWRVSG